MRIAWALGAVTLCALFTGMENSASAQEGAEGPRIKFLDDIFHPFTSSGRNPYEERIETERHDFTQSATTVGRHVLQIEAGYSYFYKDHDEEIEQAHTTPEMMWRFGLTDDIEFRLRWNYAWQFINEGESVDSAEDLRWSLKFAVTDQACLMPESALEVRFTAPTGGSAFSTEQVEFGLDYIYIWDFCERWELFGSTGFGSNGFGDFGLLPEEPASERFTVWSQSAGVGTELTERATLYAEYFGLFSDNLEDEFSIHMFNLGVDFYVSDDFVLDVRVGKGLSEDADDFFAGVGGGYRF